MPRCKSYLTVAACCAYPVASHLAAVTAFLPPALLYAPPLALYGLLAGSFALSLRAGHEPLVSRFARLERGGDLPPDLARYTRILTVLWVAFFVSMGTVSVVLALLGPVERWSLFTNFVSYLLLGAFFLAEYLFRRLRYRHHRHAGFLEFLRRLAGYRLARRAQREGTADGG
jgi:uncharacterized membrane protein